MGLASQISDGRTARGARSRAAIIEALFELVGDGILRPTAHEVAAEAGVGIRTVFRHFRDMDSLYVELSARLRSEVEPILKAVEPAGELATRASGVVAQRARMFELIAPYKRATEILRWESDFLSEEHRQLVRDQRANLYHWLPELRTAPGELSQAVELATSWESWNRLRSDQKLGVERARATMARIVQALTRELED